jgi:hypothetical protein
MAYRRVPKSFKSKELLERAESNGVFFADRYKKSAKSIRVLCLQLLESKYLSDGRYDHSTGAYRYRITDTGKSHLAHLIKVTFLKEKTYTYRLIAMAQV